MLIDERIQELTEGGAKKLLRRAVEVIAAEMACKNCAMRLVCGSEASEDDCMRQVLVMLAVRGMDDEDDADEEPEEPNDADQDDELKEAVVYYDPKTMKIEE